MALYRKKFSYSIKLKILERGFNLCLALNAPSSDVTIEDDEKVNHLVVIRWRLVNWHYKPWNRVGFHHDKLKQVVVLFHAVHVEVVKFGFGYFRISQLPQEQLKLVWVQVKVPQNIG